MRVDRQRLGSIATVVAATTAVVLVLDFFQFDPLRKAEFYSRDYRAVQGRKAPVDPGLVFMGIDKSSVQLDQLFPEEVAGSRALMLMGQGFPWSREVYALAQERLMAAGAKLVVFDLLFPQPAAGDAEFRATLDRYSGQVVLACDFVIQRVASGRRGALHLPTPTLVEQTEPLDTRMGFDTLWPDADGILRRVQFATTLRELDGLPPAPTDERYESITARSLRQIGRADLIPSAGARLFRFAGEPGTFRCHSIFEIFVPKLWTANYQDGAFFKDKIVMIGPEGSWSHDEHPTPFRVRPGPGGLMAGPEIHLQALNAALQGAYLREVTWVEGLLWLLGAALVAFGVSVMISGWWRVVAILAAAFAFAFLTMFLFNHADLFVPFAAPALIGIVGTLANVITDYRRERREKTRLRSTLSQYVGEGVAQQVIDDPASYTNALGGVRKPVTVLFSDLRNFTGLAAERDPAELVEQLNEYFGAMTEIVTRHKGTLDKLMGDSLMAVWGNLHTDGIKTDAIAAVQAGFEMTHALHLLNKDWRARDWPEFHFGIGMSHGEALVGNVGSPQQMDFTAIGDVTNVAARIQRLTEELECELVISDSLATLVKDFVVLEAAGPVSLKGRPFAVNVFIVTGTKQPVGQQEEEASS